MNVVSGPSLVVEGIPNVHELRKQAPAGRTGFRAVLNPINQMLEKSRHQKEWNRHYQTYNGWPARPAKSYA